MKSNENAGPMLASGAALAAAAIVLTLTWLGHPWPSAIAACLGVAAVWFISSQLWAAPLALAHAERARRVEELESDAGRIRLAADALAHLAESLQPAGESLEQATEALLRDTDEMGEASETAISAMKSTTYGARRTGPLAAGDSRRLRR